MSQSQYMPTVPLPNQASTSANPQNGLPASYRPHPRATSSLPFQRIDVNAIKQELHDALGENGLPYWKALNGYLIGQVGRDELSRLVKGWLKGRRVQLHNRLLTSLLYNASSPSNLHSHPGSSNRKRKRANYDDPDFDIDDTIIEPKSRVHQWMLGLSGRERARLRRSAVDEEDAEGEEEEDWQAGKKWSNPSTSLIAPLAVTARSLPSANQLSARLSQVGKMYDLNLAPGAMSDIGEFMAIGLDEHLGDILSGVVSLTGKDRPRGGTIRVPKGFKKDDDGSMDIDKEVSIKPEPDLPKPDLETFQHLFTLAPKLHSQASPALFKLAIAEEEDSKRVKVERKPTPSLPFEQNGNGHGNGSEQFTQRLLDAGLLKLDKAGRATEEGETKKDRKHNLHWKYEDPALILRDILG